MSDFISITIPSLEESERLAKLAAEQRYVQKILEAGRVLPPAIVKAMEDNPFDYACGLIDGSIIYFMGATWEVGATYVHLELDLPMMDDRGPRRGRFKLPPFERGVDVRIDHITWAADAPHGS